MIAQEQDEGEESLGNHTPGVWEPFTPGVLGGDDTCGDCPLEQVRPLNRRDRVKHTRCGGALHTGCVGYEYGFDVGFFQLIQFFQETNLGIVGMSRGNEGVNFACIFPAVDRAWRDTTELGSLGNS